MNAPLSWPWKNQFVFLTCLNYLGNTSSRYSKSWIIQDLLVRVFSPNTLFSPILRRHFFGLFGPHLISIDTVLNVSKKDHFLDPPPEWTFLSDQTNSNNTWFDRQCESHQSVGLGAVRLNIGSKLLIKIPFDHSCKVNNCTLQHSRTQILKSVHNWNSISVFWIIFDWVVFEYFFNWFPG